jgi:hypothetical protein
MRLFDGILLRLVRHGSWARGRATYRVLSTILAASSARRF